MRQETEVERLQRELADTTTLVRTGSTTEIRQQAARDVVRIGEELVAAFNTASNDAFDKLLAPFRMPDQS